MFVYIFSTKLHNYNHLLPSIVMFPILPLFLFFFNCPILNFYMNNLNPLLYTCHPLCNIFKAHLYLQRSPKPNLLEFSTC